MASPTSQVLRKPVELVTSNHPRQLTHRPGLVEELAGEVRLSNQAIAVLRYLLLEPTREGLAELATNYYWQQELLELPGVGRTVVKELARTIDSLGISRKMDLPDNLDIRRSLPGRTSSVLSTHGIVPTIGWLRQLDLSDKSVIKGLLALAGVGPQSIQDLKHCKAEFHL